ncbi:MAG: DUF2490 domain-containing protein, partial [bacterium]|nr:DUF2490 domain-containing protein [bacterium]
NRIWQQFIRDAYNNDKIILSNRTRLEEHFRSGEPGKSYRLREKTTLTLLNEIAHKVHPVTWDELFINLNEPQ